MKEAINYEGYALIDVLQPCIAFNKVNTLKWYKDRVYNIDYSSYDNKDRVAAFQKSLEWGDSGIPLGILYKQEKSSYFDRVNHLKEGPALVDRQWEPKDAERFMEDFR
jgi:2-oxoglutarate ferredoxin oxidoreductase subunit beta